MKKNMMKGTSALMVLTSIAMIASVVSAQETTSYNWDAAKLGAGIALGLCGIGTGMSQSQIGAAAVGTVSYTHLTLPTRLLV